MGEGKWWETWGYGLPERRAMRTLVAHLDEKQRECWDMHKQFFLLCAHGKLYTIRFMDVSSSILLIGGSYECWYPRRVNTYGDMLPTPDLLLGQKLVLEAGPPPGVSHRCRSVDLYEQREWIEHYEPRKLEYLP